MPKNMYTEEQSEYLRNNPTWHVEDSAWKARHIKSVLERNSVRINTLAEVGCGAGEVLFQLQKLLPKSVQFSGYDISKDAIRLANERKNKQLQFFQKDFVTTKAHPDILLMIDVFEHVEDYLGFLKACRAHADAFVFHIPLDISVQAVLRNKLMQERKSVGHLHYFMKETALATLVDSGYEIVEAFYTAATLDLPRKTLTSRLAVIPRKILFAINQDFAAKLLGGFSLMVLARAAGERK